MEKETSLKSRLLHSESQLKIEIQQLQDQLDAVQADACTQLDAANTAAVMTARENGRKVSDLESKLASVENQLREVSAKAQSELQCKIDELNSKFEKSVQYMKEMEVETLRKEMEGRYIKRLQLVPAQTIGLCHDTNDCERRFF